MRESFIVILILLAMGLFQPARAELGVSDLVSKLPALNQNIIFSLEDNTLDYAASVTLVSLFNSLINIDIGYSPKTQLLGLASIKLIEFKNIVKFPILDKMVVEPFVYVGTRRIENLTDPGEADYGVGVKIISLKF